MSKELGKRFASPRPRAGCEAMVRDDVQHGCIATKPAESAQLLAANDNDGFSCTQFTYSATCAVPK
jgi:hypothetical protein